MCCQYGSRITSVMDSKVISESGTNYVKFGNGLIIQWGVGTSGQSTITLPIPYSNTNYELQVSEEVSASSAYDIKISNSGKTTTSFSVQKHSGGIIYVHWLTIGV